MVEHEHTNIHVDRHVSGSSNTSPFRKVKFDWTVSLGALIQLGGVVGVGLSLFAYGLKFQYQTEVGLADGVAARAKYIPIIETLQKSDDEQNFRLEDISGALQEIRKTNDYTAEKLNTTANKLSDIATDIAVIKERLKIEKEP